MLLQFFSFFGDKNKLRAAAAVVESAEPVDMKLLDAPEPYRGLDERIIWRNKENCTATDGGELDLFWKQVATLKALRGGVKVSAFEFFI